MGEKRAFACVPNVDSARGSEAAVVVEVSGVPDAEKTADPTPPPVPEATPAALLAAGLTELREAAEAALEAAADGGVGIVARRESRKWKWAWRGWLEAGRGW